MQTITSVQNDKIKYVVRLSKESALRRSDMCFVVEGVRMLREVPAEDVLELFVTEEALCKYSEIEDIIDNIDDSFIYEVSKNVMEKISSTKTPQGVLAVVRLKEHFLEELTNVPEPFIFILDRIQDPGNLGTIIRTAEAVGASGVLISADSAAPYAPKTVRSTMGGVLRVPIIISEELVEDIERIKEAGITVFGTHLSGKDFYAEDFTKPAAFLIGNEGKGLSDEVSATADKLIKIPMKGKVESLNAAVSASVTGYEVMRQREISK